MRSVSQNNADNVAFICVHTSNYYVIQCTDPYWRVEYLCTYPYSARYASAAVPHTYMLCCRFGWLESIHVPAKWHPHIECCFRSDAYVLLFDPACVRVHWVVYLKVELWQTHSYHIHLGRWPPRSPDAYNWSFRLPLIMCACVCVDMLQSLLGAN